ncbi:ATP-binding cassette domain-containing protein, partial [Methylobacterium sp. J-072]|uniref:ATP-binding cassette domain-containing protein n=1 Tax=Methylobacterium sp. J-072 TaxID=2836651 RepID=UPI001FB95EE5
MTQASAPVRLGVEGLDQHYGSAQVLRGIGLTVEPGACLAVLGRNGAGKTTLLRCLTGLIPASRGRIALDGIDLTRLSPDRRARAGLAYVPQGREIFPDLTVAENLRVAA